MARRFFQSAIAVLIALVCGWLVIIPVGSLEAGWRTADRAWAAEFPRDHGDHADFKTEWWYFTGNLRAKGGREFGYQLTIFRQGVIPPDERVERRSRFVANDVYLAHFGLSDLAGGSYLHGQEVSRGAYGEAGTADEGERVAWVGPSEVWFLEGGNEIRIRGEGDGAELKLTLASEKSPVFHGRDGVSQKAAGVGRASHYYSLTRLATSGTVTVDGEEFAVKGLSWFDHEWATNQLGEDQVGWDWFSLQFDDGTELMLFQIRKRGGGRDEYSSGTFVDTEGVGVAISDEDFSLEPVRNWASEATGGEYPVEWKVAVPKLGIDLVVEARMDAQEQVLEPVAYWEGSVRASGSRTGLGYLEMTGYAGEIVGMRAGE
ncbi:MAG: lipocalin-like domain-containing protein [Chthoniobacterales bacterium]